MSEQVHQLATALELRIVGKLTGGYFGAFHVQTSAGTDAVLKLLPDWPEMALDKVHGAAELVARLRERGYPAPQYLDVGVIGAQVYTVQEYVTGRVANGLTKATAGRLLQLWRTQQGAASHVSADGWGKTLIDRARSGAALRPATNDPRVLAILDQALEVAEAADAGVFRTGDIVHGDFHTENVLLRNGRIAAVVDWEEARVGDSRADLLRLYGAAAVWDQAEAAALLREELDKTTPREVWLPIAAYLTVHHLRAFLANPNGMDWVLREAEILLSR